MDPKRILTKEITAKVRGHISEETVSETVDQFFRHGNTFLLLEIISLKREIKSLREELLQQRDQKKQDTLRALLIP